MWFSQRNDQFLVMIWLLFFHIWLGLAWFRYSTSNAKSVKRTKTKISARCHVSDNKHSSCAIVMQAIILACIFIHLEKYQITIVRHDFSPDSAFKWLNVKFLHNFPLLKLIADWHVWFWLLRFSRHFLVNWFCWSVVHLRNFASQLTYSLNKTRHFAHHYATDKIHITDTIAIISFSFSICCWCCVCYQTVFPCSCCHIQFAVLLLQFYVRPAARKRKPSRGTRKKRERKNREKISNECEQPKKNDDSNQNSSLWSTHSVHIIKETETLSHSNGKSISKRN